MKELILSSADLTPQEVFDSIENYSTLKLSETVWLNIESNHQYLSDKINQSDDLFYGVNTGFGSLCHVAINKEQLKELQSNLILSHSTGMGEIVPEEISRLMLLLKIKSLSIAHSGVSSELLNRLVDFYNYQVHPLVREYGSLGASGDLAPLAHLSLPLIGKGEVQYKGQVLQSAEINKKMFWSPLTLKPKEGIALLNGTQFCTAYLAYCLKHAQKIFRLANTIAAISIDAFDCLSSPFDHRIHQLRRQKGQIVTAREIRSLLQGSAIFEAKNKDQVQDPYSFRCIPQVHGASYDAMQYAMGILENELNAVTDNPLIFADADEIISGGNFHAQPIAFALDHLSIALAELGNISERRIYKLMSGQRGLPEYLTPLSGLHSGMMIAQYTAASMVSHNKQLCTPSSVDSIDSSNGQEDHVSMGANAGRKCLEIVHNLYRILAVELMASCQALEFRRPMRSSSSVEELVAGYREVVPVLQEDRQLSLDLAASEAFIKEWND